jgi:hypothetical protein
MYVIFSRIMVFIKLAEFLSVMYVKKKKMLLLNIVKK